MTEEALTGRGDGGSVAGVGGSRRRGRSWAVVMMMRGMRSHAGDASVGGVGRNVTLLEKPTAIRTMVGSAVEAAVRGGMRQYQMRDQDEGAGGAAGE